MFVAGLEGTGHHGVGSAFKICLKYGTCSKDKQLTEALYKGGSEPAGIFNASAILLSLIHI